MDTTGSGSCAPSSVKRKDDINWGGAREGAGRKKKKISSSASHTRLLGPSTETLSAADSSLASSIPLPRLTSAAVGFFAPRRPSIYRPVAILGPSSVASVIQADAEGSQAARITQEQGVWQFVVYLSFLTIPHS